MIRRALFILCFASVAWADGPLFKNSDNHTQQEFENIYQDIKNPKINSATAKTITVTTITATGIVGTTTNDAALAGNVGEHISATMAGNSNAAGSDTYDDLASIALTAGDWAIDAFAVWRNNGATWTECALGIGTVAGNDATGMAVGSTLASWIQGSSATSVTSIPMAVPLVRFSLAAPATIYLKRKAVYSAGTPRTVGGRISAWRMR